jgi:hypothetical protein
VDGDLSCATIQRIINNIKIDINLDWTRTRMPAALNEAGLPAVDASGRKLSLSVEDFKAVWTTGEVLCVVAQHPEGHKTMTIKDSLEWSLPHAAEEEGDGSEDGEELEGEDEVDPAGA